MLTAICAWGLLAAGATIVAISGGAWLRDLARRRPWADVLDMIEGPRVAMPLRCICSARLSCCDCAIDGVRNPRGAGRARSVADICKRRRTDGPAPCWWPACDCARDVEIVARADLATPPLVACPVCHAIPCSTPRVCDVVRAMR